MSYVSFFIFDNSIVLCLKGPGSQKINFFKFHFSKILLFENKLPKFHNVPMKNKDLVAEKSSVKIRVRIMELSEWIPIKIIPFSLENNRNLGIIEQFRPESIPKRSIICALNRSYYSQMFPLNKKL